MADKRTFERNEYLRIKKILEDIDPLKLKLLDSTIKRAAFMCVQLEELENEIKEKGSIELFKNGAQEMFRESPASKLHVSVFKNYMSAIKYLVDGLPTQKTKDVGLEGLMGKRAGLKAVK